MSNKKNYYFLKLPKDFFSDNKPLKKLRKIAGGDTYTIIYLKLLLLSLKNEGKIYIDFDENVSEEIAIDIDEDSNNVQIAINFLIKHGLMIEQIINEQYFMTYTPEYIGKECDSASRVREYRKRKKEEKLLTGDVNKLNSNALQCNKGNVTCNEGNKKSNTDIEIEKELNIEKDIEIEKELNIEKDIEIEKELNIEKDIEIEKELNIIKNTELNIEKDIYNIDNVTMSQPVTNNQNITTFFNSIWSLYPEKIGKGQVKEKRRKELFSIGFEKINLAIERYVKDTKLRRMDFEGLNYKNGSTFFNSGLDDYLEDDFKFYKPKATNKPTQATNYEQREYDDEYFDSLYDNVNIVK